MAAFATPDHLAERLGLDSLTAEETSRATALLARASGLAQDAAEQVIELVEDDVLTLRGTNARRIRLPERPVVEVTSVTLDDSPLDGWYLDGNVLVRDGLTLDERLLSGYGRGFGLPSQELEITYTHGYSEDAIPATVSSIVLEAVIRAWVNPGAVIGERHGSEQVTFSNAQPTGLLLTKAEEKAIRRATRKTGSRSVNQS